MGAVTNGLIALSKILAYCGFPAVSAIMFTYLQRVDIAWAVLTSLSCEVLDWSINRGVTVFTRREYEQHFFRRCVQPLIYAVYMVTFDWKGTVPRLLTRECLRAFHGATEEEISFVLFDNYEQAMLAGEAFNFLDYEIYFNREI